MSEHREEWDIESLHADVTQFWPSELTVEDLDRATSTDELYEMLMSEATALYEKREVEITPDVLRKVERQLMLRIIDQKWREHLREMDYLRDGIHLRAMGQKDPATEWQREGFEMFGALMTSIAQDFVKYVMHVEIREDQPAPQGEAEISNVSETKARSAGATAAAQSAVDDSGAPAVVEANEPASNQPVVRTDWEKTPRNAPCPCGSGKKFKQCHGRA